MAGKSHGVWVGRDEYNEFVAAFRECELKRKGTAVLEGSSPGELRIAFEPIDQRGHYRVTYTLVITFAIAGNVRRSIEGGFVLDSEYFREMVVGFTQLWDTCR
jgi:hypothetical protein